LVTRKIQKIVLWLGIGLLVLVLIIAGLVAGWQHGLVFRVVDHYSLDTLKSEVVTMSECGDCHQGADFHRCSTCHDAHGAVEFADLPFYNLISLTGDVPQPGFVEVNQVLPYRDQPATQVSLLDFLAGQGVTEFESVVLTASDGGYLTIQKENLTEQALLLPYTDGIRFASEDLHVSTWLKGLTGILVVGREQPLTINGESTSIGRLLLGPTRQVVVERARVMFSSLTVGEVHEAETASQLWGASVADLFPGEEYSQIFVIDIAGEEHQFSRAELNLAVLAPTPDGPTLVLPDRGRSLWIMDVVELRTE